MLTYSVRTVVCKAHQILSMRCTCTISSVRFCSLAQVELPLLTTVIVVYRFKSQNRGRGGGGTQIY